MKALLVASLRFLMGCLVGFLQALLLAIILAWMLKSELAFPTVLLLAWPLLTWRSLRKARGGKERAPLVRRSVLPLLALPVALTFPVVALIKNATGYAGVGVGILGVAVLLFAYAFCWGSALVAALAHLASRRKGP
ncbi:hypothetical protein [Pseudoduganella sp.]|uniref:hypothetical protein n=1 Tax=Pseudoduganella sp. TaxID=1880898 RepID=UPI0035AD997B